MLKTSDKEEILKPEKSTLYTKKNIRKTEDFSLKCKLEDSGAMSLRHWKEKRTCQPRIPYPAKIPFKHSDEIKIFFPPYSHWKDSSPEEPHYKKY